MHSPFLVATSTGLDEEFSKHYPLFDHFFNSFQIPGFEKEDLEDLLGEDLYNKVKGNYEFQEIVMKLFCVVIKGLKSVNNLPAPSIVPPFDVRSISCSCLYQMIE